MGLPGQPQVQPVRPPMQAAPAVAPVQQQMPPQAAPSAPQMPPQVQSQIAQALTGGQQQPPGMRQLGGLAGAFQRLGRAELAKGQGQVPQRPFQNPGSTGRGGLQGMLAQIRARGLNRG